MKYWTILTAAILLLSCETTAAVETALPTAEAQKLLEETCGRYESITSLQTSFTQVRTTRLLKKPATTKGMFYFRKPDKLLWEFTSPYRIKIFYQKNAVIKVNLKRQSYSRLSVRKYREPLLNFLNVTKTIQFLDKYFIVKKIDTKLKDIYIIFIPKKHRVKKRVSLVEAWLDADTYLFKRIKVKEKDGTITEITFHNTKINGKIPDSMFTVSLNGLKKEKWQH